MLDSDQLHLELLELDKEDLNRVEETSGTEDMEDSREEVQISS